MQGHCITVGSLLVCEFFFAADRARIDYSVVSLGTGYNYSVAL